MNDDRTYWQLATHCCRSCFGRVLLGESAGGLRIYRCAQCGSQGDSDSAAGICCCGIRLKTGQDAGVRCVVNDQPSADCPLEVVAEVVSDY
ncbi:DNA-directed RNA polymerase subunit RPC12/RpoP [Paraburkholderia sp. GAS348]